MDFYPKDIKEIAAGSGSWWGIAAQEITQKMKILGQSPEIREPLLAPKKSVSSAQSV
jgi:hypothetical protein